MMKRCDEAWIKDQGSRVFDKMAKLFECTSFLFLTVLFFFPLTSCTGVNDRQLALDPVITEADRLKKSADLKRAEFLQLEKEYEMTLHPAHLARMEELRKLLREELAIAEYFQKNHKYYRKGIDYERWKRADQALKLYRKTLCEMMLGEAELRMLYEDREKAAALFTDIIQEFDNSEFQGYTDLAENRLRELEKNRLYAASIQPEQEESN